MMRPGVRLLAVPALIVLLAATAAACGDDDASASLNSSGPGDEHRLEYEPTSKYLGQAVEASTSQPFRYSLTLDLGSGDDTEDPIISGASDGEELLVQVDPRILTGDLIGLVVGSASGRGVDDGLEAVIGRDDVYARAPFLSTGDDLPTLGAGDGSLGALLHTVAGLGDRWGHIDRAAVEEYLPEAVRQLDPSKGVDADRVQEFLDQSGGVEELEPAEIDGDRVSVLGAHVSLDDMLAFLDLSADDLPLLGMLGSVRSVEVPVEVSIDADNHVRRVLIDVNGDDLEGQDGSVADLARSLLGDMRIALSLDLTDYGDDTIAVDIPSDPVDITNEVAQALEDLTPGN
jgi:hypothetical protein